MPENMVDTVKADDSFIDEISKTTPPARKAVVSKNVTYTMVASPVGKLLLVATDRGVVRVAFEREDHDTVLNQMTSRFGKRLVPGSLVLDAAAVELAEYFAGRRTQFDVSLDRTLSQGFRREVQEELSRIEYGTTVSYAGIAARAGNAAAVRAAGTACAVNPLPVLVPCHRVVRSDGAVGSYLGGEAAKVFLLQLEKEHRGSSGDA